ncbi:MAG: hypothetical protein JWO58_3058 [Chitinophagaceae bacterium]|nr:hypothetical protein [Chitinophagaceae bacterium]
MKKQKKVTVKFFVNKTVKPELVGKEKRYPLYMILTYNRRNTTLKSLYGGYYKDIQQAEKESPGLLSFEERILQKIVRYELAKEEESFDLKGMYAKYEKYSESIENILSKHFKNVLWMAVLRSEPQEYSYALNFSSQRVYFETLYAISKKIYPDLKSLLPKEFEEEMIIFSSFKRFYPSLFSYTFPTAIEWIDKSIIEDYRKKLDVLYKKDKKKVDKSISVLNRIIFSKVEL